jgi:hypothetical protein
VLLTAECESIVAAVTRAGTKQVRVDTDKTTAIEKWHRLFVAISLRCFRRPPCTGTSEHGTGSCASMIRRPVLCGSVLARAYPSRGRGSAPLSRRYGARRPPRTSASGAVWGRCVPDIWVCTCAGHRFPIGAPRYREDSVPPAGPYAFRTLGSAAFTDRLIPQSRVFLRCSDLLLPSPRTSIPA